MPCTQGAASDVLKSHWKTQADDHLLARNKELEGMLCALISELETKYGAETSSHLLVTASVNGKAPIIQFWSKHKFADENRLEDWLKKLSPDELKVLGVMHNIHDISEVEGSKGIEVIQKFFTLSKHEQRLIWVILKSKYHA